MLRIIAGVLIGYAVWTVIWVGTHSTLFHAAGEAAARGEPITQTNVLVGMLVLSVVCSIGAAIVCGTISRRSEFAAAMLSAFLLLTGLGVQIAAWKLFPVWYHLIFLSIVPVVTYKLATRTGRRYTAHA
jgi:hypothetical protein